MTDNIENFLDQSRDQGDIESEGVFTVDYASARAKMAKYQLANPHLFILKLVQAGVLASDKIEISLERNITLNYSGWDPQYTIQRVADLLCSGVVSSCETPVEHMAIGLNSVLPLVPEGVRLVQWTKDEDHVRVVTFGENLESKQNVIQARDNSGLTLVIPNSPALNIASLEALLRERCGFSPIPVFVRGDPLEAFLPNTSGAHREIFFRQNTQIAEQTYLDPSRPPRLKLPANSKDAVRELDLRLTVDLNPTANIWFAKAGVLTDLKHLDLGVPGLTGVVSADDLQTDLTGIQFLDNQKCEFLVDWIKLGAREVLAEGIKATSSIQAEAAPITPNGWVSGADGAGGCGLGCLGGILAFFLMSNGMIADGTFASLIYGSIGFPALFVGQSVYRKGCEKDDKSDRAAQAFLNRTLLDAQSRLKPE